MKLTQKAFFGTIFLLIFFSLVLSGCPRAKKTPSDETKQETSEPQKEKTTEPSSPPGTGPEASVSLQDPIASGSTLLNPAVPKDAGMIQTRLLELGLYKGPIDGIWGKGPRAALKAFKEQKLLENPEKWDKETQVLLFSETGKANQSMNETAISDAEVLLNPNTVKDTQMIQKRLAELGLYKGPIDGIWGKNSRAALKAFKERNSLSDPEKWDKEIQILLFKK